MHGNSLSRRELLQRLSAAGAAAAVWAAIARPTAVEAAPSNPLTPNEAYFKNVDAVLQIARDNDLVISITVFHQRHRKFVTAANARAWGKWLGQRYKDVSNIVWSSAPATQNEFVQVMRELAAGLREGDGGRHLITFKPDPAAHASGFLHGEPWLDFCAVQMWKWVEQIYPIVSSWPGTVRSRRPNSTTSPSAPRT